MEGQQQQAEGQPAPAVDAQAHEMHFRHGQLQALGQQAITAGEQLNLNAAREVRQRLEQHSRNIGPCDRTNREQLRNWIEGVDHALQWTHASNREGLEMIGYLMTGSLAIHVRKYVGANAGAQWQNIKEIKRAFLDENEDEFLWEKLETIAQ